MNRNGLITATVAGTVLQLAMIIAGHFIPYVATHLFAVLGSALKSDDSELMLVELFCPVEPACCMSPA